MWHVIGEEIVESWAQFDLLDFIQQVGAWPEPDRPTAHTPAEDAPIV
jgi:hypothetical protein